MNLEAIDKPSIILHRKYIHELKFDCKIKRSLKFAPTRRLVLGLGQHSDKKFSTVTNYLKSHSLDNVHSEVTFRNFGNLKPADFNKLAKAVFDNLNIKVLSARNVQPRHMTTQFYDMIKNCDSIRKVEFYKIQDAHAQLDAVEANQNVKQWTIDYDLRTISEDVKERLSTMLSDRSDNSLFLQYYGELLNDIPQISQQFKISPI